MLPFVGADPGTSTLPQLRPRALEFEDTNPLAAKAPVFGGKSARKSARMRMDGDLWVPCEAFSGGEDGWFEGRTSGFKGMHVILEVV